MKQIIAIVKPHLAEKVVEGLERAPLEALQVREVKGYGRQKSYLDQSGDSEYATAQTGRMGDGKSFVMPAAEAELPARDDPAG